MVEATHSLKVLGYPEIRLGTGQAVQLKVRKHLALLVYLAVDHRTWHGRDTLVDLFWSDVSSERGRHSLSMALSVFRGILGRDSIVVKSSSLRLRGGVLLTDLSLIQVEQAHKSCDSAGLELERFLEGFELVGCPGFQHWRDAIDAATTPLLRRRLQAAIVRAREGGNSEALIRIGTRLSNLDALDEEGVRARMEGLALQNDRLGALRVFEAWVAMAHREVQLAPSEALQRLATLLRRPTRTTPLPDCPETPTTLDDGHFPFVGREAEFARLYEGWRAVATGDTKRFALVGEMGLGKSALASHLASTLQLHGSSVVQQRLYGSEQSLSLAMVASLIRSLLDCPGAMATDPDALAIVSRIAWPRRSSSQSGSGSDKCPQSPDAAALAYALGALMDAVTDEQPLAIILDDVLFADHDSLALVHHAVLQRRRPLLLVMAYRPFHLSDAAPVRQNRSSLTSINANVIPLGPLSEKDSAKLVTHVVASGRNNAGPVVRRAILRAANGNPRSLKFLAQDWLLHGEHSLALALPAMRNDVAAVIADTADYDTLLDRITHELAPRTRLALQLAAVVGPRMNEDNIFSVAGLSPRQSLAAISELCEYRLIMDHGDRLSFSSEVLRWRVYTRITPTIRRRLHQQVVSHLQAFCTTTTPDLEMAWHLMRAGRVADSFPFLLRGARHALLAGTPDESVHALTSALPQLAGQERQEALVLLADSYQEMGDWKASLDTLSQTNDAPNMGDVTSELRQILEIEARRHTQPMPIWEARETLDHVIDAICSLESSVGRARAALCAARMADAVKDQHLTSKLRDALLTVQIGSLPPREEGMLRLARAMVDYYRGALDESREGTMSLCHFLGEHRTTESTYAAAMTGLGALACASGNYQDGLSALEKAHEVARRLDNDSLQDGVAGNLALCNHRLGNYEEGRQWARRGIGDDASPIRQFIVAKAAVLHGQSSVFLRDETAAEAALDKLDRIAARPSAEWVLQAALLMKADLLWLLRRRRQARTAAREAMLVGDGPLANGITGLYSRWLANTARTGTSKIQSFVLLRKLYANRPVLDAIDRAELGCSLLMLQDQLGLSDSLLAAQTRDDLSKLPAACVAQLKLLGVSLPDRGPDTIPEATLRP